MKKSELKEIIRECLEEAGGLRGRKNPRPRSTKDTTGDILPHTNPLNRKKRDYPNAGVSRSDGTLTFDREEAAKGSTRPFSHRKYRGSFKGMTKKEKELQGEAMTPMEKKQGLRNHLRTKGTNKHIHALKRLAGSVNKEKKARADQDKPANYEYNTLKKLHGVHGKTSSKTRGKRPKGGY